MYKVSLKLISICFFCICNFSLVAQKKGGNQEQQATPRSLGKDTTPVLNGPKLYSEVIPSSAQTKVGLFSVHKVRERYFFEIPDTLIGRDILIVSRISKAAAGVRNPKYSLGYAGDLIGENVVRFTKGPNNKLFLNSVSFQERSIDSTADGMYKSVNNSNFLPIIGAFDIKAISKDSVGVVIDITDFFNSDNNIIYFGSLKSAFYLGSMQADKSYVQEIKAFPLNVEVRTIKTYSRDGSGFVTYELNNSIVLLPEYPMKSRIYDERVGFFQVQFKNFDVSPQDVKETGVITRWRLEPKPEDEAKYLRGELVEPQKPIVYYIDPATPQKWVPYLIQGVNDWQRVFEKIGFKNAIYAIPAPVNNPNWSIEDARHNAIVYKPSDIANASGPHIHDPRSGEILETHINWYHNVMSLLHDWYFVQASPIDFRARKMTFSDSLMGQLIRFVSSHEVGHTLGLRHNFGASSTIAVEKLRNKSWVEENGHTPSIMDYARFNYVAQPEDSISELGIFPRIGIYDEWAIEWGYKWFPPAKPDSTINLMLKKMIVDRTSKDNRLWFGNESAMSDPRCQSEDLGDNAMKAGYYGIKNLKRIIPNLLDWTYDANDNYSQLDRMYNAVVDQFNRYLKHVSTNIGGITISPKSRKEVGEVVEFVSREKQKEAILFLQRELFTTPEWLVEKEIFLKIGGYGYLTVSRIQSSILSTVLSHLTFYNLLYFEASYPTKAYSIKELLNDLYKGIWVELKNNQPISMYRRNLQLCYVSQLISLLAMPSNGDSKAVVDVYLSDLGKTDILTIVKGHMRDLLAEVERLLPQVKDKTSKVHLEEVKDRLKIGLNISGK